MSRKLKIILISISVIIVAALLFAGNYLYGQSVQRGSEVELHSEEKVESNVDEASAVLFNEAQAWYELQTPEQVNHTSADGLVLQADFIANEAVNKKAVILVHGFRKTKEAMGDYTKFYHSLGYDILMPDLRGHGDSEGDYYGYGWDDRLDIINWTNLLIDEYGMEEIVLHGNSAGSAAVLMTSGEDLPNEVKIVIADSPYTTMKEELKHQLKHIYGLPGFPLLDITSLITKVRAGYFFGDVSTIKQVKNNDLPLLVIHGDADDLVPTWMGQEIYDTATSEKEIWIPADVGHIKSYELATVEFEKRVTEFLGKYLEQ